MLKYGGGGLVSIWQQSPALYEVLFSCRREAYVITSDNGGGKCFCPRLSVCLLARLGLFKNVCMDLDEMLRVDRCRDMDEPINF